MATAGVMKLKINSIGLGTSNFILVGIIIAKQSSRLIVSKKNNKTWYVFSFTIRDSPEDFLNITAWGSYKYITKMKNTFRIGDVVDIINAKVTVKPNEGQFDRFMPTVTSCFSLTLYENCSQIIAHDKNDSIQYHYLMKLPTQSLSNYLVIADIHSNGKTFCGKYCSLMVAVRHVHSTKHIKTKTSVDCILREITVMDKTHSSLILLIWNKEVVYKSYSWIPRQTILLLENVRFDWSEFKKNMIAIVTSKTVITENPSIKEAESLRNFSISCSIGSSVRINISSIIPDVTTIVNVMSCKNIKLKMDMEGMQEFTAIVYAVITKFNIDELKNSVKKKCKLCSTIVLNDYENCHNFECISNMTLKYGVENIQSVFNVLISLTDSTGTLENCQLTEIVATNILGSVEDYKKMDCLQKTDLKWKYLLTNCAVKLVIPKNQLDKKSIISVVSIRNEGNISQYVSEIPLF
ncbi:meiosis-specific with OB domain-containing protein isoform X2 [Daktulosphaira vitifoliae]|uniref:meiosis-specific with OB domain-containing protein isoform X2 n=1 Tax=Daktulosphaira vitifoliae TaxID=58002 RepID=UPI0021AAD97E|nr:meiosis-specific with OB domain-containing protein isoform X2 [Daktulosphaira vitifoliae]